MQNFGGWSLLLKDPATIWDFFFLIKSAILTVSHPPFILSLHAFSESLQDGLKKIILAWFFGFLRQKTAAAYCGLSLFLCCIYINYQKYFLG